MVEKKPAVRRARRPVAKAATAATKRRTPVPKAAEPAPPEANRQAMVRMAAYFRAQQRGFAPGHDLEDWLAAEAEVAGLAEPAPTGKPRARSRKPAG